MTQEALAVLLHQLLRDQQLALNWLMEAMRPDNDEIDQQLWDATQTAIWAMEGAIRQLDGRPAEPWEEASLELKAACGTCGCPWHKS